MEATIIPITMEVVEKTIHLRSEISLLLYAIINTFIIEKTVISIMIAEKILVSITSIL